MNEMLLDRIIETGSEIVIVDITGVPIVDTAVAKHLLETVAAARLLGAEALIVDLTTRIAMTLVQLGMDLSGVTTRTTMAKGLALAGTRGAAISIAVIDSEVAQLTYAGVGNVEGRVWQQGREQRLTIYRGIVGKAMPTVRPFTVTLAEDWLLLMHTDWISSRFALPRVAPLDGGVPEALAERVLQEWVWKRDDAMMVVACAEHLVRSATQ